MLKASTLNGEAFESIPKDVSDLILPGVTHWQSPNFLLYSRAILQKEAEALANDH